MTAVASEKLGFKTHEFLEGFGQFWNAVSDLSIPEKRAEAHRLFTIPRSEMEAVGACKDKEIEGPNGTIPMRIFTPQRKGPFPVMLFFHHGG